MPLILSNGTLTTARELRSSGFVICYSGLPEFRDPEVEYYGALVDAQHQLVNVGDHVALLTGEDEASMDNDVFYAYICMPRCVLHC